MMRYLTALLASCLSMASFAFDIPCLDPLACNFMEEGECFFTDENGDPCVIEGCTIEGACNFDPAADFYDGSCEFVSCLGCTDTEACNYDETALYDDDSCIYYVDCNGNCGGNWIEDACGNCYEVPNTEGEDTLHIEFNYAGTAPQYFQVPAGVEKLIVEAWGAAGGDGYNTQGGLGGYASGELMVTEGEVLWIYVGGKGNETSGGWNGGGTGGIDIGDQQNGGGGGGASDIRLTLDSLESRVVVAGGGAGGGRDGDTGVGGGFQGTSSSNFENGYGGTGGTQVEGGFAWTVNRGATHGQLGTGGNGSTGYDSAGGGGGSGGYYGGGGGTSTENHGSGFSAGGGGGSSFIELLTDSMTLPGINEGHGKIILHLVQTGTPYCNPGCTYPQACNYNPESNFDDGSCDYCFCGEGTQWVDSLQACMVTEAALVQACGEGTYWDDLAQTCLTIVTCQQDLDGNGVIGVNDLLLLLSIFGSECVPEAEPTEWACGDPINYNGYNYATVLIGEQCWFAENLLTEFYANGDSIPEIDNWEQWSEALSGTRCFYDNLLGNGLLYGALYNWHAVADMRGLCPLSWHVPTKDDFIVLIESAGGYSNAGLTLKARPTNVPPWNGLDDLGFNGLPGGHRLSSSDSALSSFGYWWSSTTEGQPATSAWGMRLLGDYQPDEAQIIWELYEYGFSVRCLLDE